MMVVDDAVSVELDTAMTVRRENVPGDRTPSGILTKLQGTLYEQLIKQIEDSADPASLAIGFHLLTLSEEGCFAVHNAIKKITGLARGDGDSHDFTLAAESGGLCLHCNADSTEAARLVLGNHCEMRKYREKAPHWFGISFDMDANLQFGVALDYPWKRSDEMDEATRAMLPPQPIKPFFAPNQQGRKQKIGRNEQCPCGSGKKYKHCHGR